MIGLSKRLNLVCFYIFGKLKVHTRDLRFKQVRISPSKIEGRENRL